MPRRPATPVVRPRRKISQWKPAGLRSGNSVPCAMRDDTVGGWPRLFYRSTASLTVMVEIKENGKKNCERNGDEDISSINVPEMDEPSSILSRKKSFACRECCKANILHVPNMNKASEEDNREWGTVIFNEFANTALE